MKTIIAILGISTILLGAFCMICPGMSALGLAWILGILLIAGGIGVAASFFICKMGNGWDLVFGILSFLGGGFLLINYFGALFADPTVVYFVAAFAFISGVVRIASSYCLQKTRRGRRNWPVFGGTLSAIVGAAMLLYPFMGIYFVGWMIALTIIMQGIHTFVFGILEG